MMPNLLQHWRNRTGHSESFIETDINPHHFTLEKIVYRNIILDTLKIEKIRLHNAQLHIFVHLFFTPPYYTAQTRHLHPSPG